MHEYSIGRGIISVVLSAIDGHRQKVKRVYVKAGVMRAIVPSVLLFVFDTLKKQFETLSDAQLVYEILPLAGTCCLCGREISVFQIIGVCPNCGSSDVKWVSGNELFVEKVEVAES